MIREFEELRGNIVYYDDTLYTTIEGEFSGISRLHYIGPQDVKPVIPDGMTDCSGLFRGCVHLKEAPDIPEGGEELLPYVRGLYISKNCV